VDLTGGRGGQSEDEERRRGMEMKTDL